MLGLVQKPSLQLEHLTEDTVGLLGRSGVG